MEKVTSHADFLSKISRAEKSFLLLYKSGSEQSTCAYKNIEEVIPELAENRLYAADVTTVNDIHGVYGITSVPALLVFAKGNLTHVIKGCQDSGYYKALTENAMTRTTAGNGEKVGKRVTVYSTPTCSWCNTLKIWLRKNNINYTDVDISRDQGAAEALVRWSGQQGVPQTDINGRIVVGFNQAKLKELLEIQ